MRNKTKINTETKTKGYALSEQMQSSINQKKSAELHVMVALE